MKLFPVVVALLAVMGLTGGWQNTSQAADLLPGAAIGDDTVAIIWVDATKVKHEDVLATLKTAMGKEATLLDDAMKQFAMIRQSFINAGGEGFAIVVRVPEAGRVPDPFFLIKLKDDDQQAGMEAFLKLMTGERAAFVKAGKDGLIVAEHERHVPPLGEKPGKNHKLFMKELSKMTSEGGSPAAAIFKPNARLRAEMDNARAELPQIEQFMPGMSQLFFLGEHATKSEQITVALTIGEKPTATLVAVTKDGDAAKAMAAQKEKAVVAIKQMKAAMQQRGGMRGPDSAMFTIMEELLAQKSTVDGRNVVLKAETKTFERVGAMALKIVKMEQERAKRYALQNQMRQLLVGIQAYAADNKGNAPDKLEDLAKYVGGKEALAKLLKHPITGEDKGIVYYKPPQNLNQIERPHITALLFEIRKGKIVEGGVTGYADGHTQGGHNNFNQGATDGAAPAPVQEDEN